MADLASRYFYDACRAPYFHHLPLLQRPGKIGGSKVDQTNQASTHMALQLKLREGCSWCRRELAYLERMKAFSTETMQPTPPSTASWRTARSS